MLFQYITTKLSSAEQLTKVEEKDLLYVPAIGVYPLHDIRLGQAVNHTPFLCFLLLSVLHCSLIPSVAMSGIINAQTQGSLEFFGQDTIDRTRSKCFREGIVSPFGRLRELV